jgi:hypothetical protein
MLPGVVRNPATLPTSTILPFAAFNAASAWRLSNTEPSTSVSPISRQTPRSPPPGKQSTD